MKSKADIKNLVVLGFALFATFFGAGNLIFPPYLGLESGQTWSVGFLCFIFVDAGLAVMALVAASKTENGFAGITGVLGKKCSALVLASCALCLGPLVAIPRTAATTFELAILPIIPDCSSWISGAVFFALVLFACIRPNKVVDLVGKVLAPIMFVALIALIVKGIATPIGIIGAGSEIGSTVKSGLESGYQTMDMLGALLFSVVAIANVKQHGYTEEPKKTRSILISGLIASLGLFIVYGGLTLIGASSDSVLSLELGQAGLLLAITNGLLGDFGGILLGIIVTAACFTTAIGLVSACAECFASLSHNKLSYKSLVIAICALSYVVSNIGISTIISLASPVLDLLYPVLITLVVLALFSRYIKNINLYRGAAMFAFVAALVTLLDNLPQIDLYTMYWPLHDIGLSWVVPAFIGGLIGGIIPEKLHNKVRLNTNNGIKVKKPADNR